METRDDIYRRLAAVFSTEAMIGPDQNEALLMELLIHCFSPEEARVALHLPPFYKTASLERVAAAMKRPSADIKPLLDAMTARGVIRGRGRGYALLPVLPGMFENVLMDGDEGPWHREFARIASRLYETGYVRRYLKHPTRVVRSIPLNRTYDLKSTQVDPDHVEQMIRAHEHLAVINNCQCRQARHMEGKPCRRADRADGCIAFGDFARLYVERGGATMVSRDTLRAVVRDRIDKKLVFFAGNVAARASNQICTCCDCCCHMLGQIVSFDPDLIVTQPKYRARVDEARCTNCAKCLAACNLRAHDMAARRHTYNPARCIGCGHCVGICPAAAIDMEHNVNYRKPAGDFKRLAIRLAPSKILAMAKGRIRGE